LGIIADVVEFCTEVGEIIVVGDVLLKPVHLRELDPLVKGDLGLRGLQFEARIPSAAIRTIEAAAERMGWQNAALTMRQYGTPKTSSWIPIPGRRSFSASSRSLVAWSRSKICWRCASSSAIRASTLAPSSLYFEGISRWVSF
jgi:hypothetical protein